MGQAYELPGVHQRTVACNDASVQNVEGCPDIIIVFARGTVEPGNIGVLVDLRGKSIGMQGVDYAATFPGFLSGGDKEGAAKMANITIKFIAKCPSSSVVMSGFSQGGQVTYLAAAQMADDVKAKLSSAVVIGGPFSRQPLPGIPKEKSLDLCRHGDTICHGGTFILVPHLSYAEDADKMAAFVMDKAKRREEL